MLIDGSRDGRTDACLSDLQLDELAAGQLDAETTATASEHVASCARCRARAEGLARAKSELEVGLPPLMLPARADAAAEPRRSATPAVLAVVALVAAAAMLFLLLRPGDSTERAAEGEQRGGGGPLVAATRLKGGASLTIYVERDGKVHPWVTGEAVHPGDTLGFAYSTDVDRTLAVFDVEGSKISIVYPDTDGVARAPRGRDVELNAAVRLDDSAGPEQIVGVFCDGPVSVSLLVAWLEYDPSGAELPACEATVLTLTKTAAP